MQLITKQTDNLGNERTMFDDLNYSLEVKETKIRNWKDEIIERIFEGLTKECQGTKWKPSSKKRIAIKLNSHPSLKDQAECEAMLRKCEKDGFWFFNWITKGL